MRVAHDNRSLGIGDGIALGRDFPLLRFFHTWNRRSDATVRALLFQGAVALMLIAAGTGSRSVSGRAEKTPGMEVSRIW